MGTDKGNRTLHLETNPSERELDLGPVYFNLNIFLTPTVVCLAHGRRWFSYEANNRR